MDKITDHSNSRRAIITGSAGFIGFHLCQRLLSEGWEVCGIDGITDYYDTTLKIKRNEILEKNKNFFFKYERLEQKNSIKNIFLEFNPKVVIHLAAQAGVRYSIDHPETYLDSNLIGTFNILEALKEVKCEHFLLASTSSVYGGNRKMPYKETDSTDFPMSFYAATKKSNEVMTHAHSHLFGIPTTCFRFFTVYGPWGRPDMALFKFTEKILNEKSIDVFNNGKMKRDFTYIDDLVEGIRLLIDIVPLKNADVSNEINDDSKSPIAPWRVVNIGNSNPIELETFLEVLEKKIGKRIIKNYLGIQPGDVPETFADISLLKKLTGFSPKTSIEKGIENFLNWYKESYKLD